MECNKFYYTKVTWNGIQRKSVRFGSKHWWKELRQRIIDLSTEHGRLPNDLRRTWNAVRANFNRNTVHDFVSPFGITL